MAVTFTGKDKLLRNARLFVGGYDLSSDAMTFSNMANTEEEVDMTGWGNLSTMYSISGRRMVTVEGLQCFMNQEAVSQDGAYDLLKGSPAQQIMSFLFGGVGEPEIGDPAFLMPGITLSDAISIDGSRVMINIDARLDNRLYDAYAGQAFGYVLHPKTTEAATWNSNSVDYAFAQNAANPGSHALLHVLDVSAASTWQYKVQHSTNDSVWADLITFTANGSAITSERASSGTTVNRYVRFQGTRTSGAGSTTVICTFARLHRP